MIDESDISLPSSEVENILFPCCLPSVSCTGFTLVYFPCETPHYIYQLGFRDTALPQCYFTVPQLILV